MPELYGIEYINRSYYYNTVKKYYGYCMKTDDYHNVLYSIANVLDKNDFTLDMRFHIFSRVDLAVYGITHYCNKNKSWLYYITIPDIIRLIDPNIAHQILNKKYELLHKLSSNIQLSSIKSARNI